MELFDIIWLDLIFLIDFWLFFVEKKGLLDSSAKWRLLLSQLQSHQTGNHTLPVCLMNGFFQLLHIPFYLHHLLPHHIHLFLLLIILSLQLPNKRIVLIINLNLLQRQLIVLLSKMSNMLLEVVALLLVLANWWWLTLEFADPLVNYL